MKSTPRAWELNIPLLQLEGVEFNTKAWRLWQETSRALPFNMVLDLGQDTELSASIFSPPDGNISYLKMK